MVYAALEEALASQDLTAPQYTALSFIRHLEPISAAELSRKLGITAQATWETVRSIESRGLIRRSAIPNDKRSIALQLTQEGRQVVADSDRLVLAAEEVFFSRIDAADQETFTRTILQLRHPHEAPA